LRSGPVVLALRRAFRRLARQPAAESTLPSHSAWSCAAPRASPHDETLTLVRRRHVDRRGFLSGPGPQTIPLQVWQGRDSRSVPLGQWRVRPRERAVRRRVAVTRRRRDPDPPAGGRLAFSGLCLNYRTPSGTLAR